MRIGESLEAFASAWTTHRELRETAKHVCPCPHACIYIHAHMQCSAKAYPCGPAVGSCGRSSELFRYVGVVAVGALHIPIVTE